MQNWLSRLLKYDIIAEGKLFKEGACVQPCKSAAALILSYCLSQERPYSVEETGLYMLVSLSPL